jgi:hypothetical protein
MRVNNAGIGLRTVNPRFMTHSQGLLAGAGRRLPCGDRDLSDRLLALIREARGHA